MGDTHKIYGRGDFTITLADTDPVQLNVLGVAFKKLTVQTPSTNAESMFVGGETPNIELIQGADQTFENGYLDSIWVQGAAGDVLNCHYEY
jgi:hypothetical protein